MRIRRVGQICVCIYAQLWLKFASLKTHKNSAPSPFAVRCCGLCNFARAAFELIVVFVQVAVRVLVCVFYVGRRAMCVVVLMVVLMVVRLRVGVCVYVFVRVRVSVGVCAAIGVAVRMLFGLCVFSDTVLAFGSAVCAGGAVCAAVAQNAQGVENGAYCKSDVGENRPGKPRDTRKSQAYEQKFDAERCDDVFGDDFFGERGQLVCFGELRKIVVHKNDIRTVHRLSLIHI